MKRRSNKSQLDLEEIEKDFVSHEKDELKKVQKVRNTPLKPLNPKQDKYIKAIKNNAVTIAMGSAGTSKTYIPSIIAADMFVNKEVMNIVICRPQEGPGRHLGTLPGDKNEKLQDWLVPVTDTLKKRINDYEYHVKKGNIEFCALSQLKGRSFDDAFIIADEAEDMDIETIRSLVTRIGQNTKLVINGDIKQKNIKQSSGLWYIISLIEKYNLPVPIIEFTLDECVRSKITKMFLEVFEAEDDENA